MTDGVNYNGILNTINSNVKQTNSNVVDVSSQVQRLKEIVNAVESKVENNISLTQELALEVSEFKEEFMEFIRLDKMAKQLQLSETKIIKVRQELDQKYGHYPEIRRRVTGILQANELSLVKKETIENVTEELMLSAPGYWLAPCLIAISSKITNDENTMEKAIKESLKRDFLKSSLFFSLSFRRFKILKESVKYLLMYFDKQNPLNMSRDTVIIIDALTLGLFGNNALTECRNTMENWFKIITQEPQYINQQIEKWAEILSANNNLRDLKNYTNMSKYLSNWENLKYDIIGSRIHESSINYFQNIINKPVPPTQEVEKSIDMLLTKLSSDFDSEELPLREQEYLLQLIIDFDGDKDRAQAKFKAEKSAFDEKINFSQLLTNFVANPDQSSASVLTQKFAIYLIKNIIIKEAHKILTEEYRNEKENKYLFSINGWKDEANEIIDEAKLFESIKNFMNKKMNAEIDALNPKIKDFLISIGVMGFGCFFLPHIISFIIIAIGLSIVPIKIFMKSKKSKEIQEKYNKLTLNTKDILIATIKEIELFNDEFEANDQKYQNFQNLLDNFEMKIPNMNIISLEKK